MSPSSGSRQAASTSPPQAPPTNASPGSGPNGGRARLKSLDLQGYKTFANKAVFEFAPTITAIVGPNGSGKSNIADSIRWVLGEQSYSLLRGKKTEDMIFSGSEQRARAGMASATITFDNNDGWLPIDFAEVTVSRRAYRDGENEYLLNGQRVRLRDVSELLARCGLGERTYTIIGQGLVDAALSLKAEERRRLFEEAAGIGLYRSRREESLRRLDHTLRNLDRVRDILAELRPRLRSLERQAKRAQDYEQVRQDLQAALRQWYGHHWYRMLAVVGEAKSGAEGESAARDRLQEEERRTADELNATRARINSLRLGLQRLSQQSSTAFREREAIGRGLAVAQERSRWVAEQAGALAAEAEARSEGEKAIRARLEAAQADMVQREKALAEAEARRRELLGEVDTAEQGGGPLEPAQARNRLESLRVEAAGRAARLAQSREASEVARLELERAQERIARGRQADDEQRSVVAQTESQAAVAERARVAAQEAETTASQEAAGAQRALEAHQSRLAELRAQAAAGEARLQQLEDSTEADVEGLLEQAAARGDLKGWHGRLSRSMRPAPELTVAVRAALGVFVDGFGLESADDVQRAADQIGDGEESPAAAILSLGESPSRPRLDPPAVDGVLGNAAQLAGASDRFRDAVDALLGRTLIVTDRAAARRLLSQVPDDARLVTLKGDVFFPDGHVVLKAARPYRSQRDVRDRLEKDLAAARSRLSSAEEQERALRADLETSRSGAARAQEALRRARAEEQRVRILAADALALQRARSGEVAFAEERVQEAERRLTEALSRTAVEDEGGAALAAEQKRVERIVRLDDMRLGGEAASVHLAHAESSVKTARVWMEEANERLAELEQVSAAERAETEQMVARLAALQAEQASLRASIASSEEAESQVDGRLTALESETAPAEAALTAAEEERSALERRESQLRAEVQAAERKHSQAQIEWARRQEEQASLRRRAEDDFGLVAFDLDDSGAAQVPIPFEGLVEHLARVDELPVEYEAHVARLRLQLRRMGAVNPEAQKEYQEVRERVDFLTTQVEDLVQAESQLQGVIAELDVQMESEFQKTFEAVAREFRESFTRLFGGGSVRLTLTDPGDLSQTGIDIEARLPGRREQGLSMLSGGERSLTACALVFALLKVSPTPFCVLDEVDAMLDESNVARFREMLSELSDQTQFVIITHNRQTVQAAEVLYGVSMGPDSASRVISLQLDEAERGLVE